MFDPPALHSFLDRASGVGGSRSFEPELGLLLQNGGEVKATGAVQVTSAIQSKTNLFSSNQVFTLFAHPHNAGAVRLI
ncbi:MAG TPA: hypothetical protein VF740_07605 [Candidatus Acidoferrum sp.]